MNFENGINVVQRNEERKLSGAAVQSIWEPINIFQCSTNYKFAVVVLNRSIYWKSDVLLDLWKKAQVTVTVDGGTDIWMKCLGETADCVLNGKCKEFVPNLISGDMDSIKKETLEKLKHAGASVVVTPDQDETDYTKALTELQTYSKSHDIQLDGIYVFADTSGRFDHIIGNINTLYKARHIVGDIQVIHIASTSLTWLLRPGTHKIFIPTSLRQSACWCGIIPFGFPAPNVTTTGLKWNLDHQSMEFGSLVSTSNTYDGSPEVTVTTDTSIVWTMGIEPLVNIVDDGEFFS
ncbi:thiamin pyrophosphokinase 1 [Orussus abietinus]|uniref:thiamin pyrophosphokinase 1 n=1 Tax=Orussus abietinus TaxID=222816 RepID=UPI00062678D8|nr:thiamin pyrophosphokinase 1 [Orussus abietinus]XP_012289049.1 thiamin pyrophosphokinase 1 [Orussus abietinus]XP_012289050.1 thiamin pyrophosphokinase 1 [Orussus abietinus]XP_012289051.1 thiamin pyrophosphokinase 1 [Orussus abietinus]XP_012289052.1 thiamin pyrophosphokinase 1 [Orussus abietinus]XP_012289053.1 thiamin pyrophosphokinase 1 [Orussus abietinus]XP_012289054.1 thiamin pyrophosphokinase 1 [Orussus abietinus]